MRCRQCLLAFCTMWSLILGDALSLLLTVVEAEVMEVSEEVLAVR